MAKKVIKAATKDKKKSAIGSKTASPVHKAASATRSATQAARPPAKRVPAQKGQATLKTTSAKQSSKAPPARQAIRSKQPGAKATQKPTKPASQSKAQTVTKVENRKRQGEMAHTEQAQVTRQPARQILPEKVEPAPEMFPSRVAGLVAEDHLAVQQLLHKYCHVVDRGVLGDVADLFHPDAVLLPLYESDERYVGRDAVCGWYKHYFETVRSKVRYLRHKIVSPVIEVKGNEASSVCYLDADSITISTNQPMVAFGRYDDKFIKEGGRWWFKERAIIVYYTYPVATYQEGR